MTDSQPCRARLLDPGAAFASLTAVLWNEREAVDEVLFKVVQERLLLQAPALRWLSRADTELDGAIRVMRARAHERTEAVAQLAAVFGLGPRCTLAQLIAVAPEPWPAVLADHRTALRVLVRDLVAEAAETRRQLRTSGAAVRESLDEIRSADAMRTVLDEFRAIDRELAVTAAHISHTSALQTASGLVDRALAEFLS